jgi:hypothetical protein
MAHKLLLTSALPTFPRASQVPIGMFVAWLYMQIILSLNPYIRPEDDRLLLYAQTAIIMLLLGGYVFTQNQDTFTDEVAWGISILFFIVLLGFLLLFVYESVIVIRAKIKIFWDSRTDHNGFVRSKQSRLFNFCLDLFEPDPEKVTNVVSRPQALGVAGNEKDFEFEHEHKRQTTVSREATDSE